MSWPQLRIGLNESRKPWLNLCSQRWPRPSPSLVSNLTLNLTLGLWQLKTLFPEGRTNFKSLFLKIFKFSELCIFWSSLFYSITTEKKPEFWKKLCFTLNWVLLLLAFLVVYGLTEVGIKLNRYFVWFLNIWKKQHSFLNFWIFERSSTVSSTIFFFRGFPNLAHDKVSL